MVAPVTLRRADPRDPPAIHARLVSDEADIIASRFPGYALGALIEHAAVAVTAEAAGGEVAGFAAFAGAPGGKKMTVGAAAGQ
jgi:hypothetical protein